MPISTGPSLRCDAASEQRLKLWSFGFQDSAQMNGREMLARSGRLAVGWGLLGARGWGSGGRPLRHILLFTKASGYEHTVVKSGPNHPSLVERTLDNLGGKHGFAVTSTKDGRAFTRDQIARYDAFFFYTTGDLTQDGQDGNPPMSAEGKSALLAAIYDGVYRCALGNRHVPYPARPPLAGRRHSLSQRK